MTKTYRSDGTAFGELRIGERGGRGGVVVPIGRFESQWRIEADTLIVYDIRCTNPDMFEADEVHHDRILSVSQDEFSYLDGVDGGKFVSKRQ